MVNKQEALWYGIVLWFVVTFVGFGAVFYGLTAPYLTLSQLPYSDGIGFFVQVVVVTFGGALVLQQIRNYWLAQSMRRLGLTGSEGLLPWSRNRVGTIDGRTVRSAVHNLKGTTDDGTTEFALMAAECDADGAAVIIGVPGVTVPGPSQASHGVALEDLPAPTADVDGYTVVGDVDRATDLLTPRVRDVLEAADEVEVVYVGDVDPLFKHDASVLGHGVETDDANRRARAARHIEGDVRTATGGVRRDPDDLREMIDVVTTVADAAEAAAPRVAN